MCQQAFDAVLQPITKASGLPNSSYNDHNVFMQERDHVIATHWAGLEFVSRFPQKGHCRPIDFMGLPLLLIQTLKGELKVFHNVCRHRGMKLVHEEKMIEGMIRCPYHSWTYNLDGELKGTPHIGGVGQHNIEGFDKENYGLSVVRSHIFMNMVMINLDGNAPDFEEYTAPLLQRWNTFLGAQGYQEMITPADGTHLSLELDCNWKLAIENYCEAYHLPWVHPGLNSYSPLDVHYNIIINDNFSGQGTLNYTPTKIEGVSMPCFSQWPQEEIKKGEYISFYPNIMLGIQADHAFAIIITPLAHNKIREDLEIFYIGEEASTEKYQSSRAAQLEAWREVFSEDIFAVAGMQLGRESSGFDGGVFSPVLDTPTHHFHQWVARSMKKAIAKI